MRSREARSLGDVIPATQHGVPSEADDHRLTAEQLYTLTDWATLAHALPDQVDLGSALADLLAEEMASRMRALRDVEQSVHHQNTIYPATSHVALYVAALLADPRTEAVGAFDRGERPRQMRAVLLDWLGEMACDVGEDAITARILRFNVHITAEETELRRTRPILLRGAKPFTRAADPDVRHAAVTTVLLLLDTAEERKRYRSEYMPLVEDVLANSSNRYHRTRAIDSLEAWGQNTATLRRAESLEARSHASSWPAWNTTPPFSKP